MAPTAEVQRWSAAAVNWGANATSTGLSYAINQKLRDWIAVVNANGSNATKQIEMWKDETDATGTTYQGMVLKIGWDVGVDDLWYFGVYGTNSNHNGQASMDWNDNGSNGGYGSYSNASTSGWFTVDSMSKVLTGSYDIDLYITYDTTNGQEFFAWSWGANASSTYADAVMIFKTNYGDWAVWFNDSLAFSTATYSPGLDTLNVTPSSISVPKNTKANSAVSDTNGYMTRFASVIISTTGIAGRSQPIMYCANPYVGAYDTVSGLAGYYYIINSGLTNETFLLIMGNYSPGISLGPVDFVNG